MLVERYLTSHALRVAVCVSCLMCLAARFSLSVFPGFFALLGVEVALLAMVDPTPVLHEMVPFHEYTMYT